MPSLIRRALFKGVADSTLVLAAMGTATAAAGREQYVVTTSGNGALRRRGGSHLRHRRHRPHSARASSTPPTFSKRRSTERGESAFVPTRPIRLAVGSTPRRRRRRTVQYPN